MFEKFFGRGESARAAERRASEAPTLKASDASLREERIKRTPEPGALPYVSLSGLLREIRILGTSRFKTYDPADILGHVDPELPKQINDLQEEYDECDARRKSNTSQESMSIERYNRLMELKARARDILAQWLEQESKKAA